jgi:hypothetical protein
VTVHGAAPGNNTYYVSCQCCGWGKAKPVSANTSKLKSHFQGLNLVSKCKSPPDALLDLLELEGSDKTKKRKIDSIV